MAQTYKRPPRSPASAARRRAPLDRRLDPDLFKALGDPTRLLLLACLCKCARECTVSEVGECCDVDLSVVSRHLATLERAGALTARREGRTVFYAVRFDHLTHTLRALADALDDCAGCRADDCDC
ncbi:MAG: ArsR/SmtB family transcription factor, partial [Phycisphaerales bacterium JB059]